MTRCPSAAIEVEARRENLRQILTFVDDACARFGVTGSDAFDVKLAVEEVCTNIIEYGYEPGATGPIGISMDSDADRLVITVADRATPFDPDSAPKPDVEALLEDRPLGGLGLHLVRKIMDDLRYESAPDGTNSLTLVKKRNRPQEASQDGNLCT